MISRDALRTYRSRRFDDHRWMKTLPSRDLWAEIRQLKVRPFWGEQRPWLHQLVCFWLGLHYPEFLFLLDMGTGKTATALWIMQQLIREKRVKRGIVFVPRVINLADWGPACAQHTMLEPHIVNTKGVDEKWDMLENPRGDLTVIDYQGFHLATATRTRGRSTKRMPDEKKLAKLRRRYDIGVLDEIHKMGNHQSLWFAQMRQLTRELKYCYGLTGTLFSPPNLEPIWSQFYLVDRGRTFGENLGCFRETFFTYDTSGFAPKLVYNADQTPLLNKMMGHRSITYAGDEVNDLPPVVRRRVGFQLQGEQQHQYLVMLERMLNAGNLPPEEREAYWLRLRQICGGNLIWKDDSGPHRVVFKETPKLDELERVIDEAGDQKVCISYEYTCSGELIIERLKKMGVRSEWLYGGTKDPVACKNRFINDKSVRAFVMNSAAGGTGVDGLQKVCRYMLLYESPSSPSARSQLIKRIHRNGQRERSFIVDFAAAGTVDAGILDAVEQGRDLYDGIMSGRLSSALLHGTK